MFVIIPGTFTFSAWSSSAPRPENNVEERKMPLELFSCHVTQRTVAPDKVHEWQWVHASAFKYTRMYT